MRVRVNSIYTLLPVFLDREFSVHTGERVRVVNLPGAPPANTMNHCYVDDMDGNFIGLVHTNSLVKERVRA